MSESLIKQIYNLITSEYPELKKEGKFTLKNGWYNIYSTGNSINPYQLGNRVFTTKEKAIEDRVYEHYIATGYISQIEPEIH